jgi:hypothetical protein
VADGTDLSSIYVGAIFVDAASQQFEITGSILTEAGRTGFGIVPDADVTLGDCNVLAAQSYDVEDYKETPLIENIQIGIHAGEETNLCKYMYYMLLYFLQSRRMELENIGVQLHTFSVTEFTKILDYMPDNVMSRFVNFRAKVWFSWYLDSYRTLTRSGTQVKVDKDVWIKRGDFTVITTDENDD